MRTTLEIDDAIHAAVRDLAKVENSSIGKVLSDLAREALRKRTSTSFTTRNGVPLLPARPDAVLVTNEMVDQIREEEGI
jgi:hypothetical protein